MTTDIEDNRFHKIVFDQGMTPNEKRAAAARELIFAGDSEADQPRLQDFKLFNGYIKSEYKRMELDLGSVDISFPDYSGAFNDEVAPFFKASSTIDEGGDPQILVDFIQNFLDMQKISAARESAAMTGATVRIDEAEKLIDLLKNANKGLQGINRFMSEASGDAVSQNTQARSKLKPWRKKNIDKYIGALDECIKDMNGDFDDLTGQHIRMRQLAIRQSKAKDENRDQIDQLKPLRSATINSVTIALNMAAKGLKPRPTAAQDNVAAPAAQAPAPPALPKELRSAISNLKKNVPHHKAP